MKRVFILLVLSFGIACSGEVLRFHTLIVDGQDKIVPWFTPVENAFDNYLDKCWAWALAAPYDTNGLPISFLYCSWNPGNPPTASTYWENDVGEKIPNWVESARLYYQYSGNRAPLDYVKWLVDYSLDHGQTPTNHVWPDFPVGTANAGDTEFRGFTGVWTLWDCHVDLAADIGFSMFRMHQIYGNVEYLDKAIHVADVLASRIVPGSATTSPWPYVVNSLTGATRSRYAASWDGALKLFDLLIENNQGSVSNYTSARATLKNWLLSYPMLNGAWVDGHSDVKFDGTNNLSATCASDMCLYLLEHPAWDPNFLTNVPRLLTWAEDHFVNVTTLDGLAGQYHGAYVPAEQTAYMYRMGYQTARLGAQYALWYEVSGDAAYKDRAYRCLTYNTYMMQNNGQCADGPSETVGQWWSDCYGEAPRMYYGAMGAVPEWAPPDENHLLRSSSVVKSIAYTNDGVNYTTWDAAATEVFRLSSVPTNVLADSVPLPRRDDLAQPGWTYDSDSGVLRVRHDGATQMQVVYDPTLQPPVVSLVSPSNGAVFTSPAIVTLAANTTGSPAAVVKVEFLCGTTKVGEDTNSPFDFVWPNVPAGSYALTAKATDTNGLSRTSAQATITVNPPGSSAILGNTNEGTTTFASGSYISACRFQASSNQAATLLRAKVRATAGRYQCAIYSDVGGNASRLLGATATLTNVATGWQDFPLTAPLTLTNGTYYWLAIWSDDVNARVYVNTGGSLRYALYPFGAWPDPVSLSSSNSYTGCLYAASTVTALGQWKSNYGLADAMPGDCDDDGDGLPLLLEYALGLDPLVNCRDGLPTGAVVNGFLTLTYNRNLAATDITCAAEVSGSLIGPWSASSNDVEQLWQVIDGLTSQTVTARDRTPLTNAASQFMRLQVAQP